MRTVITPFCLWGEGSYDVKLYMLRVRGEAKALAGWIEILTTTVAMNEPPEFWEAYGKALVN